MSPLGEAGKEAIKTNASRKSCNQRTKRKRKTSCRASFVWISSPFPQFHFVSLSSCICVCERLYVCVFVLGAFNSVEATSNVSLPVEMAAVCSIVVID